MIRRLNSMTQFHKRLRRGSSSQACQQDGGSVKFTATWHHLLVKLLCPMDQNLGLLLSIPRAPYFPSPQFSNIPATSHWDSTGRNSRERCSISLSLMVAFHRSEVSWRGKIDTRPLFSALFKESGQFSICPIMQPFHPTFANHIVTNQTHLTPGLQIHKKQIVKISMLVYDPSSAFSYTWSKWASEFTVLCCIILFLLSMYIKAPSMTFFIPFSHHGKCINLPGEIGGGGGPPSPPPQSHPRVSHLSHHLACHLTCFIWIHTSTDTSCTHLLWLSDQLYPKTKLGKNKTKKDCRQTGLNQDKTVKLIRASLVAFSHFAFQNPSSIQVTHTLPTHSAFTLFPIAEGNHWGILSGLSFLNCT